MNSSLQIAKPAENPVIIPLMRILVIEDEADLRDTVVETLREEGFATDYCADGEEGLYKATHWDYDAILLDIMLPKMNGWEVLKAIRAHKQTPVMMLTALLTVLMAGLLSAFYFHEKEIREREFDQKLMAPLSSAIPHFGADAGLHPAPGSQEQRNASMQANQRGPRPMQGDAMHQPPQSMDRPEGMRPPPPGMRRPRGPNGMPKGGEPEAMYGPPNRMPGSHSQGTHGEPGQTVGPRASGGAMQLSLEERQAKELPGIMDLGFYIASVTNEGKIVHSSPNMRENISYPSHLIEDGRQSTFLRTENGYREAIHRGPGPAYSIVLIGAPTAMMYAELAILRWQLLGIGITIVILGYIIGWILAGRALKPIQSISQTAAQISSGNLSQRIDLNETESELGQMGEVLNDTFSKLDSAFEQQVRFTADASHELRTPIAVILAKCQFALMRDREPEKYVAALKTCEASAQHKIRKSVV